MVMITPLKEQNVEQWRQQNDEVLEKFYDDSLKGIIKGVLNLHELEQTGAWKTAGRRLDYTNSTFEVYLHHHTTWSLTDFRLLEEVVFEHLDELKREGMEKVLMRLKRLRKETNPLLEKRLKRKKK